MSDIEIVKPDSFVADVEAIAPNIGVNTRPNDNEENKMMLKLVGEVDDKKHLSEDSVLFLYTTEPIKDTTFHLARYFNRKYQKITSVFLPKENENGKPLIYSRRTKGWSIYKYHENDFSSIDKMFVDRLLWIGVSETNHPIKDVEQDFKNSPIKYKYRYTIALETRNDGLCLFSPYSFCSCFTKESQTVDGEFYLTINRKKCALIVDGQWLYFSCSREFVTLFDKYYYGLRIY